MKLEEILGRTKSGPELQRLVGSVSTIANQTNDTALKLVALQLSERVKDLWAEEVDLKPADPQKPEPPKGNSNTPDFIKLHIPYDKKFSDELRQRVPQQNEAFWSNKFNDFVVHKNHAEVLLKLLAEMYPGRLLAKHPTEQIWTVVEDSNAGRKSAEGFSFEKLVAGEAPGKSE